MFPTAAAANSRVFPSPPTCPTPPSDATLPFSQVEPAHRPHNTPATARKQSGIFRKHGRHRVNKPDVPPPTRPAVARRRWTRNGRPLTTPPSYARNRRQAGGELPTEANLANVWTSRTGWPGAAPTPAVARRRWTRDGPLVGACTHRLAAPDHTPATAGAQAGTLPQRWPGHRVNKPDGFVVPPPARPPSPGGDGRGMDACEQTARPHHTPATTRFPTKGPGYSVSS
jgi:hypothetical protein